MVYIGRDHSSVFDTIADTYDDTFTHTAIGRYQRAVVTDILKRRFQAGTHVLEIGCGTGTDSDGGAPGKYWHTWPRDTS